MIADVAGDTQPLAPLAQRYQRLVIVMIHLGEIADDPVAQARHRGERTVSGETRRKAVEPAPQQRLVARSNRTHGYTRTLAQRDHDGRRVLAHRECRSSSTSTAARGVRREPTLG